jgi:hypothetical protein
METIKEAVERLKKPMEAVLGDPSRIEAHAGLDKSVSVEVDRLLTAYKFRLGVEMLLFDLRNVFRGYERFDATNKAAVVDDAYRVLNRLEAVLEREEDVFLRESEIAEEMKAQAARDLEQRRFGRPMPRPVRPEAEEPEPAAEERDAEDDDAADGDEGDDGAESAPQAASNSPAGPSRRKRRSRRRNRPKPPATS